MGRGGGTRKLLESRIDFIFLKSNQLAINPKKARLAVANQFAVSLQAQAAVGVDQLAINITSM